MASGKEIVDMEEEVITDAHTVASMAVEKHSLEKDISKVVKQHFDKKYGPNWHCIVGKDFSSSISYDAKHMLFFKAGQMQILLYRMG
eukprot:CAMPEP_0115020728 /NCGR_PEP_ID=MMETSP0216-20121206/30370_1 /TAXON_ID=223996 /ORGANISM="Protocruzia adherens, Strain Boccale" /LENGTH=86 /DNA_ID=CAMNT_0002392761 /DNA_START=28 /DNA_END=288 /DNA_ORIENTATION=+